MREPHRDDRTLGPRAPPASTSLRSFVLEQKRERERERDRDRDRQRERERQRQTERERAWCGVSVHLERRSPPLSFPSCFWFLEQETEAERNAPPFSLSKKKYK